MGKTEHFRLLKWQVLKELDIGSLQNFYPIKIIFLTEVMF